MSNCWKRNGYVWKESLNSDGQQFHQYQQNQQPPLILTELTEHKKDHDIYVSAFQYFHMPIQVTRALPTGAGHSTFSYLILNCKQFT